MLPKIKDIIIDIHVDKHITQDSNFKKNCTIKDLSKALLTKRNSI